MVSVLTLLVRRMNDISYQGQLFVQISAGILVKGTNLSDMFTNIISNKPNRFVQISAGIPIKGTN